MKAVIQRVTEAAVVVDGSTIGEIGSGLLILLGVADGDVEEDTRWLSAKCAQLRIFEDAGGRMNQSVVDAGGAVLLVSQFTLLADCRKGRRPSFTRAAEPGVAEAACDRFAELLRSEGLTVETGRFRAHMVVSLVNDGPVTIVLDSADRLRSRRGGSQA
ncbi:D-tyrosyl-tRNA(Tyr) deacylase [bacterium]|nr:D-tyrosyl-tRNA(Tyr) deacylase [bacterium]